MDALSLYHPTVLVIGLAGLMLMIQLLIVDVVLLKNHHVPGYPVENDHANASFRATRAFMNTNESIAVFILMALFCVLSSASPSAVNIGASVYLASRIAHMVCYYFNWKLARSSAFGVSLIALISLFVVGLLAWLG